MTLHMLQLALDARGLASFAHARGLRSEDEGYLLHSALREAFGGSAPQPFRLLAGTRTAAPRVLGYAPHDHTPLIAALEVQPPDVEALFPTIVSKRMPETFRAEAVLGFELRACPTVREQRKGEGQRGHRELDVWLKVARASPRNEPVDPALVYRDWLAPRLAAGGAELLDVGLHRLEQMPLVRRPHRWSEEKQRQEPAGPPRRLQRQEDGRRIMARRPDATFRGTLRVTDPDRFGALLARGVGRHRAFGFGMLLLRPPGG